RTFSEINTAEDQYSLCRELCRDLAQELQKEGLKVFILFKTLLIAALNSAALKELLNLLCTTKTEVVLTDLKAQCSAGNVNISDDSKLFSFSSLGVRVSGFLTEEEKKYQQKSITSFLKSGKEIDFLRLQPEKSSQEYSTKNSEAPHRGSFFDQKRAARQLNSENISPNESRGKQLFPDDKSSANIVEEIKKVSDSRNSNVCKIFTCPVCFEKQSSNNLEELNRHIDECLNGMCVKDTVEKSKNDSSRENTFNFLPQFENEYVDKCRKNKTDQLAGVDQSASVSDSSTHNSTEKFGQIMPDKSPKERQPSNLSDIARNTCMKQCLFPRRISQDNEDHFDKTENTEGISSSCFLAAKEDSVLVCPVCNSEQKTTNLMSFNRHVDVCLNKGLIQELTEKEDFPTKTYNMENSNRVFSGGLSKGQQCTNPSQGTKRSGLTASQSVSKKAKSSNSKHTIEMFFK
ncbi:POLK polymerase, partial [Irena cyanogastra]|nr:POLK polymerase [Irena cyanogastra]